MTILPKSYRTIQTADRLLTVANRRLLEDRGLSMRYAATLRTLADDLSDVPNCPASLNDRVRYLRQLASTIARMSQV